MSKEIKKTRYYKCEYCGWYQEVPLTYPIGVFKRAIEVHNEHFCKKLNVKEI